MKYIFCLFAVLTFSAKAAVTTTPVQPEGYVIQALSIPQDELNQWCEGPLKDAAVRCSIPKDQLRGLPGQLVDAQITNVTKKERRLYNYPELVEFSTTWDAYHIKIDFGVEGIIPTQADGGQYAPSEFIRKTLAKRFKEGHVHVQFVYTGQPL